MQVDAFRVGFGGLPGGEDYVAVVGQHDDVGSAGGQRGVDDFAGAGVEGLAAGHDGGAAGVLEQGGDAGAGGDGDHGHAGPDFVGPRSLAVAGGPVPVLEAHVVDLDFVNVAVSHAKGQRRAGILGVNVNPNRGSTADDDGGIGNGIQPGAEHVNAQLAPVNHELRAVAEFLFFVGFQKIAVDRYRGGLRRIDEVAHAAEAEVVGGAHIALEVSQRSADDGDDAQAA